MLPTLPVDMSLTAEDHADLEEFLEDAGGMAWAAGYFAALSTGPDLVVPSTWLPALLGDEPFENQEDAAATIALLLAYQGEIGRKVGGGDTTFCPEADDAEGIGEFSEGFLEGARLQASWGKDEDATLRLFTFAALAGEVRDEDLSKRFDETPQDPNAWREAERTRLGQRVLEIRNHWDARKKATREPVRVGPKVGRNDPCPCGSGKKHKKCCLA